MSKEITIDEIIENFCISRCGAQTKTDCFLNGSSSHCLHRREFADIFKNCTITRKTNSELAEEKLQNALECKKHDNMYEAYEELIDAYELLKKGDRLDERSQRDK